MTHFGSGIWSYTSRMTGAIFCERRPETIIRSAWRGLERNTSEPKRARSNREAVEAIISIAQQARPNVTGQSDVSRLQSAILLRKKPGEASFTRWAGLGSRTGRFMLIVLSPL